jgi:DNA-binding transcriptional ArsR family regulator
MSELLSAHDLALVEATAQRVLELLAERDAPAGHSRLVSAGELAEVLGVSRDYVYRHAERLGAVRLGGDGPRSEHGGRRLRFDVGKAIAAQSGRQAGEESQTPDASVTAGQATHGRQHATGSGVPQLPDRGGNRGRGSRARTS